MCQAGPASRPARSPPPARAQAQAQAAWVLPLLSHVQSQEPKGLLEALMRRCRGQMPARGQSRQDGATWDVRLSRKPP